MGGTYSQQALEANFKSIRDRLNRIEDQTRILSEKAGVSYEDPKDDVPQEVIQLAQDGKRLEAVKAYRDATGAGMDQAMEVVAGL